MAIISVEVPDKLAFRFKPFTIIKYETLISSSDIDIEFDFKKENIDQYEFLAYLKSKNG